MENIIRKIVVGTDPLNAMAYTVGKRFGDSVVEHIIYDERHAAKTGKDRYMVYLKHPQNGVSPWKKVENMPVIVEYDKDF